MDTEVRNIFKAVEEDTKFFDVDAADVETLRRIVKGLGFKVRLWFNPPSVRGGKGPQPTPTQVKLVYEKKDQAYGEYVAFELRKDREARSVAKGAIANAVAKPGA